MKTYGKFGLFFSKLTATMRKETGEPLVSRLTDLIAQAKAKDLDLGTELEQEFNVLSTRRSFGLNFERHRPETVELPGRPIRKGDKVRILPSRGETKRVDNRLWRVIGFQKTEGIKVAELELLNEAETVQQTVSIDELVVLAEFQDYIYPGLVCTGKVERGGDKPYHTVINGENYHALNALTFTHGGKIDAVYIDPPYNTGAKDWKYNNDYVDSDDIYRHSKWLAMMERRLLITKQLLNPKTGILIVAIDENESNRLGLLLEQNFPEYTINPIHIVHNPRGVQGDNFSYVHETVYYVIPKGSKLIAPRLLSSDEIDDGTSNLRNWGGESLRSDAANCFFPILVKDSEVIGFGDDVTSDDQIHPKHNEKLDNGIVAVWPIDGNGTERKWRYARQSVENIKNQLVVKKINRGPLKGNFEIQIAKSEAKQKTIWHGKKYDASSHGTQLLSSLLPKRKFPFPKSLYAVQECLDIVVRNNPNAVILDFFGGSGTTTHAVMLLNKQYGGQRQCILITNNEVGSDEQRRLKLDGHRQGDPEWEQWGICDYITKPRIKAAITGKTSEDLDINGEYRFNCQFPMSAGVEENAKFFTLTYETPIAVSHNRAFARIAPLLWMRAGSEGRRINSLPLKGWDVADTYGILADLDKASPFCKAVEANNKIKVAYIVTDDDRRFQSVARYLPDSVEPVRLYESYLSNFRFSMWR